MILDKLQGDWIDRPGDSDFWHRFNVVAANVVAAIEREGAVLTPAEIRVIREATLLVILGQTGEGQPSPPGDARAPVSSRILQ